MSRHTWTTEQRVTLCVLGYYFQNSWDDFTEIFNTTYRTALRSRVLQAQICEINNNRRGGNVLIDSKGDPLLSGTSLQASLQKCECIKVARECGIKLVERVNECLDIAEFSKRSSSEESDFVPGSGSSISSGSPTRARKRRMVASKRHASAISRALAIGLSAEGMLKLKRDVRRRLIIMPSSDSFTPIPCL